MVLTKGPNNVSGPKNVIKKTYENPNNAVPVYTHIHTHYITLSYCTLLSLKVKTDFSKAK